MKKLLITAGIIPFFSITQSMAQHANNPIKYPITNKQQVVDDYFGTKVADPYQWLENDTATEVTSWVDAQNQTTQSYLAQVPYRSKIKNRLTEIWDFPKYGVTSKHGDYYYFSKNNGLQNQSVIYYQKGLSAQPEVFLDPNKLSTDGTVSLAGLSFSDDNKYCAVSIAKSGSDWNEIFVMDVATKQKTTDNIMWVKFSGATWHKNGFYYSRYDAPVSGKEFSNANECMKIYYHTIGAAQTTDKLVFEDKAHPLRYFTAQVTEDGRFLLINVSEGTSGSEVLFKDLKSSQSEFKTLFKGFDFNCNVIENVGDKILLLTDLGAPKYRLVLVDPLNPSPENWKNIIPESADLLESVSTCGGKLFANYLKNASSRMYSYNMDGTNKKEIVLPGIGTTTAIGGKAKDTEAFFAFTSFTNPGEIYKYNVASGTAQLVRKTDVKFNTNDFETKQVFYPSKDGTMVSMFLVYKKGLLLNGTNPTLLYGYGGFNISMTPSFSVSRMMFLEQGGVYAIANLRGGGEYGEEWHKAGMLDKKQNVFDDFIAAAEYLIQEQYTSPTKLAIHGGSNGGLLVGACMTQRPDLFCVVIPAVGVLDMLKYHKFTIGWGWAVEYGSSDKKEQFDYLIKYSPLHNVKAGINYPATMIMTADHDDRVVPAHSFKFASELQSKQQKNGNPVLIRIDSKAGHGAGKPTSKLIDDATDMWSFILWNLNVEVKF